MKILAVIIILITLSSCVAQRDMTDGDAYARQYVEGIFNNYKQ